MRPSLSLRSSLSPLNPSSADLSKALGYATNLVRTTDADSIWNTHFYPAPLRPAYIALRAFNVELATIDDGVSNAMVGRVRYQWWRDAIKGTFNNKPPPHPITTLLSSLPQFPALSSYHFTRLINAREAHFLNPSFPSLQSLADYSAGTQASLLYLLLQATAAGATPLSISKTRHATPFEHTGREHLDEGEISSTEGQNLVGNGTKEADDLTLDHAASHLAVANTIAVLLRSIPHHTQKRISVIPTEIASRHALKEEVLFRQGPDAEGLRECVATLVGIAEAELRTARSCFDGTTGIPKRAVPVFLAATPARSFLERLASPKIEFDVFSPELRKRFWKLPFQVWSDNRNKKF